jgi:hypothetical protein
LDLVVGNQSGEAGSSLSFLSNRGLGSFFPQTIMTLEGRFILQGIAAGDFDADGDGDVAVAVNDRGGPVPLRAAVLVLLNDGTGRFASPVQYSLDGIFPPTCLLAADVTGDGFLDLTACQSRNAFGSTSGLVQVLAGATSGGRPTGQFEDVGSLIVGTDPVAAVAGRLDGDDLPDLVVVDPTERSVFALYGTGAALPFAAPVRLAEIGGGVAVLTANVDDTALADVLVLSGPIGRLRVLSQTASRTFVQTSDSLAGLQPTGMVLGPFDAFPDLVIISGQGADLFARNQAGGFDPVEVVAAKNLLDAITVADLNGDSRTDIAAVSSTTDRVTVVLNGADAPPTPTLTATATPTLPPTPTPTRTGTGTRTATPTRTATVTRTGTRTLTATITGTPTRPTETPTATPTPTPTRTPIITTTPLGPGDANCDGRIDRADVDGVIRNIFDPTCSAADVDGDDRVLANDVLRVLPLVTAD